MARKNWIIIKNKSIHWSYRTYRFYRLWCYTCKTFIIIHLFILMHSLHFHEFFISVKLIENVCAYKNCALIRPYCLLQCCPLLHFLEYILCYVLSHLLYSDLPTTTMFNLFIYGTCQWFIVRFNVEKCPKGKQWLLYQLFTPSTLSFSLFQLLILPRNSFFPFRADKLGKALWLLQSIYRWDSFLKCKINVPLPKISPYQWL